MEIYINFTGRIGKDAQVINSSNGQFMAVDMVVNNKVKGVEKSTWLRVRSSKPQHVNLAQHLTKGKIVAVHGTMMADIWQSQEGPKLNINVNAYSFDFLNFGKKQQQFLQNEEGNVSTVQTPAPPVDMPNDNASDAPEDNLPF